MFKSPGKHHHGTVVFYKRDRHPLDVHVIIAHGVHERYFHEVIILQQQVPPRTASLGKRTSKVLKLLSWLRNTPDMYNSSAPTAP